MQDIPMYSTECGIASLVLREIPYSKTAYIRIHVTADPEAFLKECVDFCIAAGADIVYGQGHDCLNSRPLHTTVLIMQRSMTGLPETDAYLVPVHQANQEDWRRIYNERMENVPNAAYIANTDIRQYVKDNMAYFVFQGEVMIGLGIAADAKLHTLASVLPGAGQDVVLALCKALRGETVTLEVASTNACAMRLYQRLGFVTTGEKMRWYKIL